MPDQLPKPAPIIPRAGSCEQVSTLEPKPWWASRSILGALGVIVAGLLQSAHVQIGSDQLSDLFYKAADFVFAALAIYGRVKASRPIAR